MFTPLYVSLISRG
jgi:hypothetical protein